MKYRRKEALVGGVEDNGFYRPLRFGRGGRGGKDSFGDVSASVAYNLMFADGYAYLFRRTGDDAYRRLAVRLFRDGVYYLGMGYEVKVDVRAPLGYHYGGSIFNACGKVHAFTTRFGQAYLGVMRDAVSAAARRR